MKTGTMVALGAVSLSAVGVISYLAGFSRGYKEAQNDAICDTDDAEFCEDIESYDDEGEE